MGIARSTLYAETPGAKDNTALVEAIARICEDFEHYGWRCVRAALRQQGIAINHKKVCRLMRSTTFHPGCASDRLGEHVATEIGGLLGKDEPMDHVRCRDHPADPQAGHDALRQRAEIYDRSDVAATLGGGGVRRQDARTHRAVELQRQVEIVLNQPGTRLVDAAKQPVALRLGHQDAGRIGKNRPRPAWRSEAGAGATRRARRDRWELRYDQIAGIDQHLAEQVEPLHSAGRQEDVLGREAPPGQGWPFAAGQDAGKQTLPGSA